MGRLQERTQGQERRPVPQPDQRRLRPLQEVQGRRRQELTPAEQNRPAPTQSQKDHTTCASTFPTSPQDS
ncbi:hypothetical protein SBRY_30506 [Actinacidiphila bryophytorum]|uniref:Uncharacterized protein n=1 Tax=Actinacidiphila bryophytorum TaxID=1436133 RepID=A0A9W4H160_9ACTN|nr:hypothetical protein SBRY_30506 [Actinacidiphila bryophytorum]